MKTLFLLVLLCGITLSAGEAEQFFREYQHERARDPQLALEKLNAALALAPDNPLYRVEEMKLHAKLLSNHRINWRERIDGFKRQLERVEEFKRKFPDYKLKGTYSSLITDQPFTNQMSRITREEFTEMSALCDVYRAPTLAEIRVAYYPYDLSDGINSIKELENFYACFIHGSRPDYWFDYRKYLAERLKTAEELLDHAHRFAEANPGLRERVDKALYFHGYGAGSSMDCLADVFFPNYRFNDQEAIIREHLTAATEFAEKAKRSPFPRIRRLGLLLEFMRKSMESPPTAEAAEERFDEFFAELQKSAPELLKAPADARKSNRVESILISPDFARFRFRNPWIGETRLKRFRENNDGNSDWKKTEELISSRNWEEITARAAEIRNVNFLRITANNTANLFGNSIVARLFNDPRYPDLPNREKRDPEIRHAFAELNKAFEIETRTYEELFQHSTWLYALAAAKRPEGVHLLLSNPGREFEQYHRDGKLIKRKLSPMLYYGILNSDGTAGKLLKTPLKSSDLPRENPEKRFAVSESHLAVGTVNAELHIYDRRKKRWANVNDFLSSLPHSVALAGDRLYVLSGSERLSQKLPLSLRSMRLDGSGRKTHFNTARSDKQHPLDSLTGWIFGLTPVNDGRELLFIRTDGQRKSEIYRLDTASDEITLVVELPWNVTTFLERDGKLLLRGYSHGERYFELDSVTGETKCFFATRPLKEVPSVDGMWMRGNFLRRGDWLWVAGDTTAIFDLKKPDKSPMLLLPPCTDLFGWGEDRVLYLTTSRFFTVTKK